MKIKHLTTRSLLCLLAWCTLAAAPTFAQTITHVPLFTFDSGFAEDRFGTSVSSAGDVNGDGLSDLIVGDTGGNGLATGDARVYSGADGSIIHNFVGQDFLDFFADTVSDAGDVNGDGFADLIVGTGSPDFIGVQVFSGVDGSLLYDLPFFGGPVSGAGDVNGDGFDDVVVSETQLGFFNNGQVRVHSGVDGSILYTFEGDEPTDKLGRSVSGAGDVNGDGFDDVIAGTVCGGEYSGSARVFSGADGSILYDFDGDSSYDSFGISVSCAGDVNGDGFADVIVGAPANASVTSGYARVFSGADGSILYNFEGNGNQSFGRDLFGYSVSGAGDVNGDGFDDLIVGDGANKTNGTAGGCAHVFSGADGSVIYTFEGNTNDSFGISVSCAGDVNGDGIADLIVGAPGRGSTTAGYARVFVSQITVLKGDVNQDGVIDFADIPALIAVIQAGVFQAEADCDCSGMIDFADIPAFIAILMMQ